MKILLMSMPDVAPLIVHETAIHMPNLGIASIGANIDPIHDVAIIDLIRRRGNPGRYLEKTLKRIQPAVVGFTAMTWQFDTCARLMRLARRLCPGVKIVLGGYHATLMFEEISESPEAAYIDFIVRGEGEVIFRRLIDALDGKDRLDDIPGLSFKNDGVFIHNDPGDLLNLNDIRLPIRDGRRLTRGYHVMFSRVEVMETSRGCTRTCNFCSMNHMYGRSFRAYPVSRVLADLDMIYHQKKTRSIFIVDDNFVLDPQRVIDLCDAVISRRYKNLSLVVQADSVTMSRNEEMIRKMVRAGFTTVFLGIENASVKNLRAVNKGDIVNASKQAVALCHKHGLSVIGGLILGFPDDDERSIIDNYQFFKQLQLEGAYCQILTPYPKTRLREELIEQGLVTNIEDYSRYSGLFANVKTRHLDSETLQYLFWYHKQTVLGWWRPSPLMWKNNRLWSTMWALTFKPLMTWIIGRQTKTYGWKSRYGKEIDRLAGLNDFNDI